MSSSRRTYREYRNDPTVKPAWFAWLLDRWVVYAAVGIVAVIGFLAVLGGGWQSLQSITTEPTMSSPYRAVVPASSIGIKWGGDAIAEKPEGVDEWSAQKSHKPEALFSQDVCGELSIPSTVISTHIASGSGVQVRIQVLMAGQSSAELDRMLAVLTENCRLSAEERDADTGRAVAIGETLGVVALGDTLLGVVATSAEQRDALMANYTTRFMSSLKATNCADLNVSAKDSTRNIYADATNYTGYIRSETVEPTVNTQGLPTAVVPEVAQTPISRDTPEGPLPKDFPKLPETPGTPSLDARPELRSDFTKVASYQVIDRTGPGCGWNWTGQLAPAEDSTVLQAAQKQAVDDLQAVVNSDAQKYVDAHLEWANHAIEEMPAVEKWNAYTVRVAKVYEKWSWLEQERANFKPQWDSFLQQHEYWRTFDDVKAQAESSYNAEVQKCADAKQELLDWEEKWGDIAREQEERLKNPPQPTVIPNPTPQPTPTPGSTVKPTPQPSITITPTPEPTVSIPEKPEGCTVAPVQPEILTQSKPAEPTAPTPPKGVTIPESWAQPQG